MKLCRASLRIMAVLGWLVCACAAWAEPSNTPQRLIHPDEQAARDSDRVAILRQELQKSETVLETLARRKAERLGASDATGATETEEQRIRTLSDIAGLKRELAAVTRTSAASSAEPAMPVASKPPVSAPRSTAVPTAPAAAPWWDVYSKGRHGEPSSISLAPSPEAAPRPVSARRLE
jgi:hypothetical protein